MEEPGDEERCDRCGHPWERHKWIVYTECDVDDCGCRYFVAIPTPEYQAECAARAAGLAARAARLATMTREEIEQLLRQERQERTV